MEGELALLVLVVLLYVGASTVLALVMMFHCRACSRLSNAAMALMLGMLLCYVAMVELATIEECAWTTALFIAGILIWQFHLCVILDLFGRLLDWLLSTDYV